MITRPNTPSEAPIIAESLATNDIKNTQNKRSLIINKHQLVFCVLKPVSTVALK